MISHSDESRSRKEDEEEALTRKLARIDSLVASLESTLSPEAKDTLKELVRALLDVHATGLSRMLRQIERASSHPLLSDLMSDDYIAGLLLLHDLHPVDLETRARLALEKVRPQLLSCGAEVELLGVKDGVVRLRLHEASPASPRVLFTILEQVIAEAVPDADAIEWEGIDEDNRGVLSLPLISSSMRQPEPRG